MKKSIYITASIFILGPISINATTLVDCQTKALTATTQNFYCDSNQKVRCRQSTECNAYLGIPGYISQKACETAHQNDTKFNKCEQADGTEIQQHRNLECYSCEHGNYDLTFTDSSLSSCKNKSWITNSDDVGYYSYSLICSADFLGAFSTACWRPKYN